jgi:putative membrane protein
MNERIIAGLAGGARVLTVLLVALVAVSGVAVAHGGDDGMHHHDGMMGTHDGWMGGAGWFWGPVGMLLLLAVPLVAIAYVLRSREDTDTDGPGGDDALAVLRRRYAEGDIDDDEFENRRRQLRQS